MSIDYAGAVDWENRTRAFGDVFAHDTDFDSVPAFTYKPSPVSDEWRLLARAWLGLEPHPVILRAMATRDDAVVVRYAAIVWFGLSATEAWRAMWARQLIAAYQFIAANVPADQWWLFTRPDVHVDLGAVARIGFQPPLHSPVHIVTERDFVDAVIDSPVWPRKSGRSASDTLADCDAELVPLAPRVSLTRSPSWAQAEEAMGWVEIGDHNRAGHCFEAADRQAPTRFTRWGATKYAPRPESSPIYIRVRQRRRDAVPRYEWADAKPIVTRLEAERDFAGAMAVYCDVSTFAASVEFYEARANCHLALGEHGLAIDYARRALVREPSAIAPRLTLIRALISRRDHVDALAEADALIVLATHDARAHYLRGKALIGLGRPAEARDAFDLALVLKPTMLEAMLLRREADRTLARLGCSVGQQQPTIAIPESLEPLREILTSGRSKAVIEALSAPSLADDAEAQLMLARFLGLDGKHDAAIAIYDRYTRTDHQRVALVGKAMCLFEQGSIASALAILDAVTDAWPTDIDACEAKARVLDTLGRTGEAAAEFRRFVALALAVPTSSNLRVRAAQLWLQHH